MRRFKRAFALFLSAVMLMGTAAGCGKSDSLEDAYNSGLEESAASGDDTGYVASLTPASDYYGFINGEKLLGESLNEKYQEIDSFQEVDVILEEQMDSLIDEIVSGSNYEKGSYEQIVHDMYVKFCQFLPVSRIQIFDKILIITEIRGLPVKKPDSPQFLVPPV